LNDEFEETPMSGDELDRTIEFLLQNAARSDARFDALRQQNLEEHARLAGEQATFQQQLRQLGDHVTVMTETLTATLTAMNERDIRQDRRLAKLESHIKRADAQIERVDSQIERVDSQIERVDSHIKRVDTHIDRVDTRVERVDALIERIAKIVYSHVSDPHAHGPATG